MAAKKWKNPFYTLLIPVGMVFVVTVFAYGFMAFLAVNGTNIEATSQSGHPLFAWLDKHGTQLVLWELAVLGVLTVGAIATDSWWIAQSSSDNPSKDSSEYSNE
ncbi:hypothetical protein [Bythopirellula polymerisocia]|uniref:Uncharacterized protein n=1 Tax=Bythopirellula polymerisocia TaxID=2528003 RepID=A0A5C6CZF4_9BACT|nr:hypothetical protein [Bythopirellula polymerisocia]TWU28049.1 hypothetical protein Pla144_13360 [Bythopirellula polymerisocia]